MAGSAVAIVVVLLVGAGVAAVQYGARAVEISGGGQSITATGRPVWIGIEIRNASAVPVTLREFVPRGSSNLQVTATRVIALGTSSGIGMLSEPLDDASSVGRALAAGVPVHGFELPPGGHGRYQVAVRLQRLRANEQAVLQGGAVTYSALGLDQGALTDGVSCIRAHGAEGCSSH